MTPPPASKKYFIIQNKAKILHPQDMFGLAAPIDDFYQFYFI